MGDKNEISTYDLDVIKGVLVNEIMSGKEVNGRYMLNPKGSAIRAEAAKLIMEFNEII